MGGKNKSNSSGLSENPPAKVSGATGSQKSSLSVPRKVNITKSVRAGLILPCSRVLKNLRKGQYANTIQVGEFK